ncbi:serine/threonine protein kinase [Salmonella enterica subsp. enterica serovar Muenster]|nr:serine/threonine protein kinase [Salmonella enterica subsp. enterica serovar Muenster]
MYQVRIHVAPPLLLRSLSLLVRSCLPWHYPNSPKKHKTTCNPRHNWIQTGSEWKITPLRVWLYPQ